MSIKNIVLIGTLLIICSGISLAQSQADREINRMANELVAQISAKGFQDVVIDDFVDQEKENSPLGKHLTSKFFNAMFKAADGKLNILDRQHFERFNQESKFIIANTGLLDQDEDIMAKLRGADLILAGNFSLSSSYVFLNIRGVELASLAMRASAESQLLLTPSIRNFIGGTEEQVAKPATSKQRPTASTVQPLARQSSAANYGNLNVQSKGCQHKGSTIVCQLNITSQNQESNLSLYAADTKLTGGNGRTLSAASVSLGQRNGNSRASQIIRAGQTVSAQVVFKTNGAMPSAATLQLRSFVSGQSPFFITINNAF